MTKHIFGTLLLALAFLCGCNQEGLSVQEDAYSYLTNAPAIDLAASVARAKAENKIVLLDFTGSDWCPACIELHKEILSKPEFKTYAESNLIFQVVDFPRRFRLPPDATAANEFLSQKFSIEGFPTLVALDGDGKEVWRELGVSEESPREFIATLNQAKQKAK